VPVAPVSYRTVAAQPAPAATAAPRAVVAQAVTATPAVHSTPAAQPVVATPASATTPAAQPVVATAVSYSTSTAQGVANIMANSGTVGHWGGNPGYEGCGSGGTAAAAYNNCCYSTSGMATVDVGYARGRNGMWFCCRRYR